MAHGVRAICGLWLGLVGFYAAGTLLFVPAAPSYAGRGAALRGSATGAASPAHARGAGASGKQDLGGAGATLVGMGVAALLLAGHGARRARSGAAPAGGRAARVATRALGSIEQFKTFGPPDDQWMIETDKVLGVGGQGTVYLCHRVSNPAEKFAVKTLPIWRLLMDPSSDEKIAAIEKECKLLLQIQGHKNVAQCLGCYDAFRPGTSQAQYKMIVMELIPGGELADVIAEKGALPEDVAQSVLKQTVEGLQYCHSKQVLHRDLKCENILVCGETLTPTTPVKLIDFGVAKFVGSTLAKSCVGTTEIMAPELVAAKMMIAPKGAQLKEHGPVTFKSPREASPGFGIVSQRPDGKGAMVNGIEPGGQAAAGNVGDGWAIATINGVDITEKPFVKDFNELGAGTQGGVTAIAEMLGSIDGDFTMTFVELPKREFSTAVDMWSLGVVLYTMLAGKTPFKDENAIVNGEYLEAQIASASPDAKDLLKKLLVLNPAERMTVAQVLAHPWVAKAPVVA